MGHRPWVGWLRGAGIALCGLAVIACVGSGRSSPPGHPPTRTHDAAALSRPFQASASPVRPATASDVVGAAAALTVEPLVLALPAMAAGLEATVRLVDLTARTLPELFRMAVCDGIVGPTVAQEGERLELPSESGGEPGSWRFVAGRRLTPARPGPLARPPTTAEQRPVELELRPGSKAGFVEVDLWSGGWLLCALPSLAIHVDGKPLDEQTGGQAPEVPQPIVNVDAKRVHARVSIPKSLLRFLLTAQSITIRWDAGTATLHPATSDAARKLAAMLENEHVR